MGVEKEPYDNIYRKNLSLMGMSGQLEVKQTERAVVDLGPVFQKEGKPVGRQGRQDLLLRRGARIMGLADLHERVVNCGYVHHAVDGYAPVTKDRKAGCFNKPGGPVDTEKKLVIPRGGEFAEAGLDAVKHSRKNVDMAYLDVN